MFEERPRNNFGVQLKEESVMSFQEYLALWDQVYLWCEGEREQFIEGARQYA